MHDEVSSANAVEAGTLQNTSRQVVSTMKGRTASQKEGEQMVMAEEKRNRKGDMRRGE